MTDMEVLPTVNIQQQTTTAAAAEPCNDYRNETKLIHAIVDQTNAAVLP